MLTSYPNNCGRPQTARVGARLAFIEGTLRKRSVDLLLVGAVSGFLGFALAGFLGIWRFMNAESMNFRGEPFTSGHYFYPETVNEVASATQSPAGKCFFAFGLVGAVCILFSYYPYYLRNVYIGDDKCIFGIAWSTLRTFLPSIGLLLTVCVRVRILAEPDMRDYAATGIHCLGAAMMIGGYAIFEAHALYFSETVRISSAIERILRWCCVAGTVLSGGGFVGLGYIAFSAEKFDLCCADVWRVPTAEDVDFARGAGHLSYAAIAAEARDRNQKLLYDTASGVVLQVKILKWCEVLSGFFMIAGLLTIWYFSVERDAKLAEDIRDVDPAAGAKSGENYGSTDEAA